MNRHRVRAVVDKEFQEIKRNKMVLGAMAAMPLIFVAMILVSAYFLADLKEDSKDVKKFSPPKELIHLSKRDALFVLLNDQYMLYFLMLPMMIPTSIAAASIVGEKQSKSLEPLLATPVTTSELLVAKTLAALIPAVAITWAGYAVIVLGMWFIASRDVALELIRPMWLVGFLVFSPLLAMASTQLTIAASSRFNDVRTVQGASGIGILALTGFGIWILVEQIYLSTGVLVWSSAALVLINIGMLALAVRLFQRETILTRWK